MNAPIDKMAAVEDFMSGTSGKALFCPRALFSMARASGIARARAIGQ
jgi:hypothetical protein